MRKKLFTILLALVTSVGLMNAAVDGKLSGAFSVSGTKVVYFSKGNLQATTNDQGATLTWGFAENQWDYVGDNAANTSFDYWGGTGNGSYDLFGWIGESSALTDYRQYGIGSNYDFTDCGNTAGEDLKADWGSLMGSDWRTLTYDEWQYLIKSRNNAANLLAYATVNGKTGLILLPDSWTSSSVALTITTANYTTNIISASDWSTLEEQGCVFLPAAGWRSDDSVGGVGEGGDYWSSSSPSGKQYDEGSAYCFFFDTDFSKQPDGMHFNKRGRGFGLSVRLVSETAPTPAVSHTYTAVGHNLAIFSNSWDPSITDNDLVLQEDGSYKLEKENVSFTGATTIQYRVCKDHAWDVAYPATSEDAATFEIPSLGDYKITITYNPVGNVVSASAEKIAKPTIQLNGNFSGEWTDTEAFEVVEQPMDSYAKLTKLLEPGTYEFGVKVNGEWRANGSAYTRDNYSYIIEEGHTGNLTINVDVKGYYSFFWYYDNNRLIIDYSRVCGMYWKDVTAGNFEVTLGQEGEVTLPKVWATSMAFAYNIFNGVDQVRLGSTDETVATIAYTLSEDGLGTLTFHQAGECDIYVVHDITNLYCYDSCAFHLTVHPAPTPVTSYAVEFALGDAEGVAPAALDVTVGEALTMPVNKTLYKAGYTLTGWSDGVNTYPIGESFTPANDVVLTPVFTANEADLLNASTDVTVKWYFGGDKGAPTTSYEGTSGLLVAQATIGNKTVDVKLAIDATSGKFAPQPSTEWANVKVGTIFTYPYKEGMTVDVHTYSGNVTYYLADGNVTCGANDLYSFIEVTYPASAPANPVIKLNADFGGVWADTEAFTDNGNGKASWTISTLTAGEWYHFGVKVDDTWTSDNAAFDRANPSRVVNGTGDAMWFQADVAGEYTFTWEYATNTLTIGFPNFITINGTPAVGDNSISLTYYFDPANVPGIGGYAPTLKVKCVEDDKYDEEWLSLYFIANGTQTINFDNMGSFQAGKTYQICFAYYANSVWHDEVFQTLTFSSNTVGMKGSWDNWVDVVNFTDNGNGTASVTKTFEHEGYYTFKTVLNGDDWRGNGEAFKRNYTGAEGIVGNTDMTLWVDAKGEYTFTWTYASNRIDITYPALPTVYLYLNGSADAFTDKGNGTATYDIHFSAKGSDKEFKIRLGESDWRSNGQTFNPENTTYDWINDAGGGAYMKIYIDAEADYTLTWTYVENKLEITHPVVPDYSVATNVDPEDPVVYYSTFYSSNYSYKLMDDGTVAFIAKISNGDLVLTQIAEGEQVIPAGTAVIFRKTGSSLPVGLRDTEENNTSFDPADNDLEGVNVATPVTDIPGLTVDNCYVLSGKSHDETVSGVGFYKIYGNTLKQHKAYVKYAGSSNNAPKKMRFVYGQATGIEDVQGNNVQSTKVIENGVLYIIRDGKTYNAMGQMVK